MTQEALKQALEALTLIRQYLEHPMGVQMTKQQIVVGIDKVNATINEALAQPEQPAPVQQEQSNKPLWMDCVALADAIHYPSCWDTGAYPELDDALHELARGFLAATPQPAQQESYFKFRECEDSQPAQPEQEPVACKTLCELCVKRGYTFCANAVKTTPIYTTPPQRTWVGLTPEQIQHRIDTHIGVPSPKYPLDNSDLINFALVIADELKGKNT